MGEVSEDAVGRHRELVAQVRAHDRAYYVLDAPTVSDREYDRLFAELKSLEQAHPGLVTPESPTQRVGAQPREGVVKAEHPVPMYSLDNSYDLGALEEFDRRVRERLGDGETPVYVAEPKIDGASLEVIYRDGLLAAAITRGDGVMGEDATANARTIRGLPLSIPEKREVILRGEVFIHGADLEAVNVVRRGAGEEPFANPRNAASGALRLLDPALTAARKLRISLYDLVYTESGAPPYFATHSDMLKGLQDWGLPTHGLEQRCETLAGVYRYLDDFESKRSGLPYPTDGVVLKVDALSQRQELGFTARFPRWAIAYKFAAEQATTRLLAITGDVGRTGALTPVAELQPVALAGTTVARASLHNVDYIAAKDIRVGDTVVVQKAGEIIPQVMRVVLDQRPPESVAWTVPTECPSCKAAVVREEGEAALRCPNGRCPGRLRAALFHFTRRTAMDVDHLGKVLIDQLVAAGLVQDLADVFALPSKRDAVLGLERMAEKSVDNLLASVERSRTERTFAQLLTGLGIPLVGASAAKLIAGLYPDLPALLGQDLGELEEKLAEVHGIGAKMASSMVAFLGDPQERAMLERMIALGLTSQEDTSAGAAGEGPLVGQSFCVTGTLSQPRPVIHEKIRAAGGEVHDRVKKGTTFLVAGENTGKSKKDKAESYGTKVIDEPLFRAMLAE